eukprot:s37_g11.t1
MGIQYPDRLSPLKELRRYSSDVTTRSLNCVCDSLLSLLSSLRRRLIIMAGLRLRNPAQIPSDMFTWLAGQQVKVKNTFLDDVLPDHSSSNESTLTGEAMTCPPEFTRRRSDAFSSSSGSHGAGQESLPDVEMPSTMLTMSTPPMTLLADGWQQDLARDRVGQTPVVEPLCTQGIDDFRRATLETQQLLAALQAMPALPFTDLVLGSHPPLSHHVDVQMPLLPEVAVPPAVLSTLPCCRDADYSAWKPAGAEAEAMEPLNSDSDKASPLSSASPCQVHDGLSCNGAGYAAKAKAKPTKKHNPAQKIWCHFFIDPTMLRNGFDVNKKLIGHGGANTKRIYEETGAKIRLRGRGSGHHEGDRGEAPVPLMLAVTSDMRNQDNFLVALDMSAQLLQTVTNKYPDFCKAHGIPMSTSPLFWVGELSQEALSCLSWVSESKVQIGKVPVAILVDVSSPTKRAAKSRAPEALQ